MARKKRTDRKVEILNEFNEMMKEVKSVMPHNFGKHLWELWQEYTGRTAPFRNCSACVSSKILYLKKEYKKLVEENESGK